MSWMSGLNLFLLMQFVVGLALYFTGLLLVAINELFLDGSDKATIKSKIEDFWLFTADLTTAQKLTEALRVRKNSTRRRIPTFIKLFWFLLLIVFAGSVGSSYREDRSEINTIVRGNITFDLDFQSKVAYIEATKSLPSCLPGDRDCEYCLDSAGSYAARDFIKLKNNYLLFLDNSVKTNLMMLKLADMGPGSGYIVNFVSPFNNIFAHII